MLQVNLPPGLDGSRLAYLREPCAKDELGCADTRPWTASYLIDGLLVQGLDAPLGPQTVWTLPLSDRDRLVAALHQHCFGDAIESTLTCTSCQQRYELRFSLQALLDDTDERAREAHRRLREGGRLDGPGFEAEGALLRAAPTREAAASPHLVYEFGAGLRFRAPVADDERALAQSEQADGSWLLERCLVREAKQGGPQLGTAEIQLLEQALDQLAPILSLQLEAQCTECQAVQQAHFDMAGYFLAQLSRERPLLIREIHCLARAYGWSHSEILELPRSLRQAYVALVLGESEPEELWS